MTEENVTLKQIAELAGVSITTVHRVLNGKGGYSQPIKEKILHIAKEQGYTVNYAASSIRKHTLHIALIFPANGWGYAWYLQSMLDGYLEFRRQISKFNIVFQEYYSQSEEDVGKILHDICQERPVAYDGVVIYDIDPSAKTAAKINYLLGKRIPVVMLEKDSVAIEGACCVCPDQEMAGQIAGNMMEKMLRGAGKVTVLAQNLQEADQNAQAFVKRLEASRPDLTVEQIFLRVDMPKLDDQVLKSLENADGVYMTSARNSVIYLKALERLQSRPTAAIGSELFDESRAALNREMLDAVIDKRPFCIGYHALEKMFACLVKNEPLPRQWDIVPRIILQANCDAYAHSQRKEEGLWGQTQTFR